MNKILITIAALVSSFVATAQVVVEEETVEVAREEVQTAYQAGKFTVALSKSWGYNGYTSHDAETTLKSTYGLRSGYYDWVDNTSDTFVGVEGGWFFLDDWKLTLEFGLSHTYRPGYDTQIDPIKDPNDTNKVLVPGYKSVASESSTSYRIVVGGNRYFTFASVPKLAFYGGARLSLSHGIRAYNDWDVNSQGVSSAESVTFGLGLVSGVDYFFLPEMYAGLQITPMSYSYNMTGIKPVPGVAPLRTNAHNFSMIGSPTLKIGFIF